MYTKRFKEDKFIPLRETFEELQNLRVGDKVTLTGLTLENLKYYRWLIYDWLHHMNLQKLFKVSVREGDLVIIRRDLEPPTLERHSLTVRRDLEPTFEALIKSDDPVKFLQEAKKKGDITAEEMGVLLDKYNQVME